MFLLCGPATWSTKALSAMFSPGLPTCARSITRRCDRKFAGFPLGSAFSLLISPLCFCCWLQCLAPVVVSSSVSTSTKQKSLLAPSPPSTSPFLRLQLLLLTLSIPLLLRRLPLRQFHRDYQCFDYNRRRWKKDSGDNKYCTTARIL